MDVFIYYYYSFPYTKKLERSSETLYWHTSFSNLYFESIGEPEGRTRILVTMLCKLQLNQVWVRALLTLTTTKFTTPPFFLFLSYHHLHLRSLYLAWQHCPFQINIILSSTPGYVNYLVMRAKAYPFQKWYDWNYLSSACSRLPWWVCRPFRSRSL